jgi:hypothetical protein
MKTTNNSQKSGNWKTIGRALSAILTLALISFTSAAHEFKNQAADSSSETLLVLETSVIHSDESINYEAMIRPETKFSFKIESSMTANEYNAAEFVEPEMTAEIETWVNNTGETECERAETDLSFQAASLTNISEYNATKFVDAEIELEIESWESDAKF